MKGPRVFATLFGLIAALALTAVSADPYPEVPSLASRVEAGELPPVADRLPQRPARVVFEAPDTEVGEYGGELRMLMGKAKDIRQMMVYGYARLVGYNQRFELEPDLLERIDVEENRVFTMHLRPGHRWSDGYPFTTEAFRYYWDDIANNPDLSPFGPPQTLMVDGEPPRVEILDAVTVRYSWSRPNPYFLPALAGARPLFIYRPGHYLKQFHARYVDPETLQARVDEAGSRNWQGLHHRRDHPYKFDNPELPTLQPWYNTTPSPSERFIFERNPFYHRTDSLGRQLPYIDRVVINVVSSSLVPAKTGAGDSDLQARYLRLDNYTFLKAGEQRNDFTVRLWQKASGSQVALFPNLNSNDSVWRELVRDVRFRRALSLAVNRHEVNQVVYFGMVVESNNTVLPNGPLYKPKYQTLWANLDLERANQLLDKIGLTERDDRGIRLRPDGKPLEIEVHTAGESTEETDVLELIHDSWLKVGIKLYTKPSQREVFRNRVFSGEAMMSVWSGLDNGIPTADMSPSELAPTAQDQLQWPKWGQYFQTGGNAGEPPDLPAAVQLVELNERWRLATTRSERESIWHQMLDLHADQVLSIGIVCGVHQPVVINNRLRNVPDEGWYNWDPGAYFGLYRPDTFWFSDPSQSG